MSEKQNCPIKALSRFYIESRSRTLRSCSCAKINLFSKPEKKKHYLYRCKMKRWARKWHPFPFWILGNGWIFAFLLGHSTFHFKFRSYFSSYSMISLVFPLISNEKWIVDLSDDWWCLRHCHPRVVQLRDHKRSQSNQTCLENDFSWLQ